MKIKWKPYYPYVILVFIIFSGCLEPFIPEVKNYENLLVVEAFLSDDPSFQSVKLSRSYPIDTTDFLPESNAIVKLQNVTGNEFDFFERESGSYYADTSKFLPIPGESYMLIITTRDGRTYQSDPVIMTETPAIEDVYFERKTIVSNEANGLDEGLQIYVNTGRVNDDEGYFKFDWEEAWEYQTPFDSFLEWDFDNNEEVLRKENISVCWSEIASTDINLATTENIASDFIEGHPIRFVPFREASLRIRYSILVKQYALSQSSYRFWEDLKESNESTGSLYDTQPFQVAGNVHNTQDRLEPVLGYFDMAVVKQKRIFINRKADIPLDAKIPSLYPECLVEDEFGIKPFEILNYLNEGYLIVTHTFPPGSGFVMAKKECVDCRLKDVGINVKPDFWDE